MIMIKFILNKIVSCTVLVLNYPQFVPEHPVDLLPNLREYVELCSFIPGSGVGEGNSPPLHATSYLLRTPVGMINVFFFQIKTCCYRPKILVTSAVDGASL